MAVSELAGMVNSELEQRLTDARQELFNLRFQLATGQLDNTARVGQVRREVARVMTVLRQRELAGDDDLVPVAPTAAHEPSEAATSRARRRLGRRRAAEGEEAGAEAEASAGPQGAATAEEATEDVAMDTEEEG